MKIRIDNRYIVPLAVLFVFTAIYLVTDFRQLRDAAATGGAFTSGLSKHGGGTIDGETYDGVNRQIGSPFEFGAAYYDDLAGEAGEYEAGECMHCHEPHASFGTAEPPPNVDSFPADSTAPNEYLLFMANGNDLCWYCHNELDVGYDPFEAPQGYGHWGFYQGDTNFQASSHGTDSAFLWPGDGSLTNDGSTWPRTTVRTSTGTDDSRKCINCHSPHGVAGSHDLVAGGPTTGNFVVDSTVTTTTIPRQLIAREEALCLNCHDEKVATTNIKAQVDKYLNSAGSGHPVRSDSAYNRHNLDTESNANLPSSGWFTAAEAHAECTDCHNPHRVEAGTVFQQSGKAATYNSNRGGADTTDGPVSIGKVNNGVWGVSVTIGTGEVSGTIANLEAGTDALYSLCLKCHSAWAFGTSAGVPSTIVAPSANGTKSWTNAEIPSTYYLTDVAKEFSTANKSYHPVYAQGKNKPETAGTPVRNPNWCTEASSAYSSSDTCTAETGTRLDLEDLVEDSIQYEQTLSQTFVEPWRHTSYITCVDCHEDSDESGPRGPHGSDRPFILRVVDTSIQYDLVGGATVSYTNITTLDRTIFCWNCHRADVYGSAASYSSTLYINFSRQPHPVHGTSLAGITNTDTNDSTPRNGIACMGCHGGGAGYASGTPAGCTSGTDCKLGNIHGSDYNSAGDNLNNRLIAPGGNWNSFVRGDLSSQTCVHAVKTAWGACGQHSSHDKSLSGGSAATYIYSE